jgi:hypothetical protein
MYIMVTYLLEWDICIENIICSEELGIMGTRYQWRNEFRIRLGKRRSLAIR